MAKQVKPINIRMTEELNERIEDYWWNNRMRVSTFIREILEEKMNEIEAVKDVLMVAIGVTLNKQLDGAILLLFNAIKSSLKKDWLRYG